MVKIRLKRIGRKHVPLYRIVVADSRRSRDGKYLEAVGFYNPKSKQLTLNKERVDYWLSKGAQTTDVTKRLINRYKKQTKPLTAQENKGDNRAESE
ncbi:MAG: 30S ribosomal protein S16 [candidate division WOR-3 bacterium]